MSSLSKVWRQRLTRCVCASCPVHQATFDYLRVLRVGRNLNTQDRDVVLGALGGAPPLDDLQQQRNAFGKRSSFSKFHDLQHLTLAEFLQVGARMLRVSMPAVIFMTLSGILTGLLYALKRFTLPAFAAVAVNTCVVGTALLFSRQWGVMSMAVGQLIGALAQMLLQ